MFAQATASSIAIDNASSRIIGLTGPTIASCKPSIRTARSPFVSDRESYTTLFRSDVRAGDRQQHRDRQREQQNHRLDRTDHRLLQAIDPHRAFAVRVRSGELHDALPI